MTKAGKRFEFFGVCHNKFKLDDKIWEAVEDPDDGYRSYLETVQVLDNDDSTFFAVPVATVKVVKFDDGERCFKGYQLVDVNTGHVWLQFGTDNYDDWYPCFRFEYTPDLTQTINFDDLVSDN